jgi:hypothetical protein
MPAQTTMCTAFAMEDILYVYFNCLGQFFDFGYRTQGLKPALILLHCGTTKVVPCYKA